MVYKITELLTVLISAVLLFYMYGLEVLVHEQKSEKVSVLLAVIVAVLCVGKSCNVRLSGGCSSNTCNTTKM